MVIPSMTVGCHRFQRLFAMRDLFSSYFGLKSPPGTLLTCISPLNPSLEHHVDHTPAASIGAGVYKLGMQRSLPYNVVSIHRFGTPWTFTVFYNKMPNSTVGFRPGYFTDTPYGCSTPVEYMVDLYPSFGARCIWFRKQRPYWILKGGRLLCIVPIGAPGTYTKWAEKYDPKYILEMIQAIIYQLEASGDAIVLLPVTSDGIPRPDPRSWTLRSPIPNQTFALAPVVDEHDIRRDKWLTPGLYVGSWGGMVVEVHVFLWNCHSEIDERRYWNDVLQQYDMISRKGIANLFPQLVGHVSQDNVQVGFMFKYENCRPVMHADKQLALELLKIVEDHDLLCVGLSKGLDYMTFRITDRGCIFSDVRELREVLPSEVSEGRQRYHADALDAVLFHNELAFASGFSPDSFPTFASVKPMDIVLPPLPQISKYDARLLEEHVRHNFVSQTYYAIEVSILSQMQERIRPTDCSSRPMESYRNSQLCMTSEMDLNLPSRERFRSGSSEWPLAPISPRLQGTAEDKGFGLWPQHI